MTYIPLPVDHLGQNVQVTFGDVNNIDAFGRLRTGQPVSLFAGMNVYKATDLWWDSAVVTGGAVTHRPAESGVELSVTTASGARAVYQSKKYLEYHPGRSTAVAITFVTSTPYTNTSMRVGYFDDNNGIFLRIAGTGIHFVRRTDTSGSPSDADAVAKASWSIDPMDGTGPSGITLDFTKNQILFIDLQWLGVGRVRCGFIVGGVLYYAHEFLHTNTTLTLPYMRFPALPARAEIINTAASTATEMTIFCAAVDTEGGEVRENGFPFGAGNIVTISTGGSSEIPICSIRPAATLNSISTKYINFDVDSISVICSSAPIIVRVRYNPALTSASWAAVDATNSGMEFDYSATAFTGGVVLDHFFAAAGAPAGRIALSAPVIHGIPMTINLAGTADILTITAQRIGATNADVAASFRWIEAR